MRRSLWIALGLLLLGTSVAWAVNKLGADGLYAAVSLTADVTGTLPVANGGTGAATLTSGSFLVGAGTSAVTFRAAGLSATVTVRDAAGTGTCTLIYTDGLKTGGTC